MNPRRTNRSSRGPGAARSSPRRRVPKSGGGGGKTGMCGFAIPLAAARTAVTLSQQALVRWQTGSAQ